jgi:PKD repeat protein
MIIMFLTSVETAAQTKPFKLDDVLNKLASRPQASFTYDPSLPAVGQAIQFIDASEGNPTTWLWDFGDGTKSTVQNPVHSFTKKGFFKVTLTVKNSIGSKKASRTVMVAATTTTSSLDKSVSSAAFVFTPEFPLVGETVQFTDQSSGNFTSWLWNFGDGATSTSKNPTHIYSAPGTYGVVLTVTGDSGSQSSSKSINVSPALSAAFSFSPASPTVGQAVQFTDSSAGSPTAWLWNFGDGSTGTSQNPTHIYATAGSFSVTLTISRGTTTATTSKNVIISPALSASFTFTPQSPAAGEQVQFTDTSAGNPTSWLWNFGDGTASNLKNPAHTYSTPGTFNVTLTVSNASGSQSASKSINVSPALSAAFSFSPASPTVGQAVQFTDSSTGSPTAWLWNFGDGSSSTDQNPTHTYAAAGSFSVTLTINRGTTTATTSKTVTVSQTLSASFTFSPQSPAVGEQVQFTDTSTGNPTSWLWNFGDTTTSTAKNPSHAFLTGGTYSVILTVTNSSGSKSTTGSLTVADNLAADFTYSPSSPVVGQAVQFTDLSTGNPTSWSWDFGDGKTSSVKNPSHTYESQGPFSVKLAVSNGNGSVTATKIIDVGSTNIYWVSPTGTATWANARSTSPLSGTACCSLTTANANAQPGDTIMLRGGTYSTRIEPSRSGTANSRITYQAYSGETPLFVIDTEGKGRWAILLQGRSYITIDGITSQGSLAFFFIGYGSCYNEIKNCIFEQSSYLYALGIITAYNTSYSATIISTDNWIHDNIFTKYGAIDNTGNDLGTIKLDGEGASTNSNNTIENNVFSYGGHDAFSIMGYHNVVRNNVFHNEEAYYLDNGKGINSPDSGYFGNRCLLLENGGDTEGGAHDNLVEGNRIGYAGCPPDDDGAHGIEDAGYHTIIRYNYIYGNGAAGYYNKKQGVYNGTYRSGSKARVYHNTIYHNGYGDPDIDNQFKYGVEIWSYVTYNDWPEDVVVKNNIVYGNRVEWRVGTDNILPQITYVNNLNTNPDFLNPDLSDKTSLTLPNLAIASGSSAKNAAISLTTATTSGSNSTTLHVADAWCFQDGTWGSALTRGVTMFPDWIAIGTVDNVVQIQSVDYTHNTIVLASPKSWNNGAEVWLYKNSKGDVVLYGSAPDIGAYEYPG